MVPLYRHHELVKKIAVIFIFFIFVAGCAAKQEMSLTPARQQGGLTCTPNVFNSQNQITLHFPTDHPKNFAIRNPNGDWYYLVDQGDGIDTLHYASQDEISLRVKDVTGVIWEDGKQTIKQVFTQAGHYLLYMANNLETEPENTFWLETTVYYQGSN